MIGKKDVRGGVDAEIHFIRFGYFYTFLCVCVYVRLRYLAKSRCTASAQNEANDIATRNKNSSKREHTLLPTTSEHG